MGVMALLVMIRAAELDQRRHFQRLPWMNGKDFVRRAGVLDEIEGTGWIEPGVTIAK